MIIRPLIDRVFLFRFISDYYVQVSSFSGQTERAVPRSAALMAVFGIGVSSFSVKQMMNSSPRRF